MIKLSKSLIMSVSSLALVAGLFTSSAYASIKTATAYIDIGTIGSSSYNVIWEAETKTDAIYPQVGVSANVYFNDIRKDNDSSYPRNSRIAEIAGVVSGSKSIRGLWEINSIHTQYNSSGKVTDQLEDYDKVRWDPAAFTTSTSEDIEETLSTFQKDVVEDILISFDLEIEDYDFFKAVKVSETNYSDSLKQIVVDVMEKQQENDIMPYVYIHQSNQNGYILEKKKNGTNVVHTLVADNDGKWTVDEVNEKKGKKVKLLEEDK
ncbi:hypothetical protein T458_10495 [Brevibacillus panacihumi W25]|uniref:Uncharacterized protein n=1 Tax=Brevibacillus panacihumi W25 TaxID=1408254 RepID=V6MI53_9BACL|nr:hypothetical protein [Brevibacillus panacihumi]EST55088.1 hypothetical protein T458_10495 [Brevibacillus panacihumi W25]